MAELMHNNYGDITSRIEEAPSWFDEHGVPRYGKFEPSMIANIYWRECMLAQIRCQACHAPFLVAFSFTPFLSGTTTTLEDKVRGRTAHYGDPPNLGCCGPGPSMNSEFVRVLEFWRRDGVEPVRIPELEVSFV